MASTASDGKHADSASSAAGGDSSSSKKITAPDPDRRRAMDAMSLLNGLQRRDLDDMDADDSIIDWVAAFTADEKFLDAIEGFIQKHAPTFEEAGLSEFGLGHTSIFAEFQQLAEDLIEGFLQTRGVSSKEFYRLCRQELEEAEKAGRHSSRAFFIQLLMSCTEFEQFAVMMRRASKASEDARMGLLESAEKMYAFLSDTSNCPDVDASDRKEAIQECEAVVAWYSDNAASSLSETGARQEQFNSTLEPLLGKYTSKLSGDAASADTAGTGGSSSSSKK